MAVVLTEGFDHLIASLVTLKGWSAAPSSMVAGRFSGQAFRFAVANGVFRTKLLPSTYTTLFAGFAYRTSALPSLTIDIYQLRAGATQTFRVQLRNDGKVQILNSSGTVIAIGTTVLNPNAWNYIEVKAFINGASGTCELHLNGAAEIASTVGNFGSTNLDTVCLGFSGSITAINQDFDDLYVADSTGAAPRNTFLGDVRVETLYPSGDGAHTAWTPNSGTAHFSRVNEKTGTFPDDDTSYVSDATPGDIDTYACDDLSISSGTVYAVQTNLYARKDDANLRQIADVIRQGGTDSVGSTQTLNSTYAFYTQIHQQDSTGTDWTISNVNADEFGVEVIA